MLKLLDLITPWYVKAGGVALVVGMIFASGWYVESLRWSKAESKVRIAMQARTISALKANAQSIAKALNADAAQAINDAKTLEELERITNEVLSHAANGPCLGADDVDGLRRAFDATGAH